MMPDILARLDLLGKDNEPEDRIMILATARKHTADHMEDGVACLCCNQLVKIYRRKLTSTMAANLIWLIREFESSGDWVHVQAVAPPRVIKSGGDMAKLVHWELIESKPNEDTTKRTSGLWRPTEEGKAFASGHLTILSHTLIYNNQVLGHAGSRITIQQALGARFDYQELMTGTPSAAV